MKSSKKISVIILASGNSTRFGKDKIFTLIDGTYLIEKTVIPFEKNKAIDEIIITASPENYQRLRDYFRDYEFDFQTNKIKIVLGGKTRHESSFLALQQATGDYVLIHDGARYNPSEDLIERIIDKLDENTGIAPTIPLLDSVIKQENGEIEYLVRNELSRVQTPQAFDRLKLLSLYREAYDGKYSLDDITDNGGLWIKKYPLITIDGEPSNVKITTPDDLPTNKVLSVGNGYDLHRLVKGRKLFLGGIEIENDKGLEGVSDADVVLHALMDALLSSAGLTDIGNQFPENDKQYIGIRSTVLLTRTLALIEAKGYKPYSIALTVLAQKPKLSPYIQEMRYRIAEFCSIDAENVGITATTTEGIGLIGREEGIACYAVVFSEYKK